MVPSVQNFKFCNVSAVMDQEQGLVVTEDHKEKVKVVVETISEEASESKSLSFKLTEREIFGFIWQSPKGKKINIRDDQVISRQVTNFVKNVSCQEMTADEDGLIVTFSSQADLTAALAQFCSPKVPDTEQLSSLSRKFTLLPSRGFFGLFSVKRVKPEHFSRFGDCKVRNCGIWFADKLSMCKVLRDPFISKTYPALFIDCRNIYILSSKNSLPPVKSTNSEKPAASSALKPNYQYSQCQGVMTRSATAKLSTDDAPQVPKQDEKLASSAVPNKSISSESADTAIVTAVTLPVLSTTSCPLLATLLKTDKPIKTVLGHGKFGYMLGKFGHIPSARMVRTGYKQSKMPTMARDGAVADLFLEDRDCYRSKDIKEASILISNIMQGKMSEVTGATLREIKMKRVERFLKDKLGVECKLAEEGKKKLKDGGMVFDNVDGKEGEFTKLIKPACTMKSYEGDELKKFVEVKDDEEIKAFDAKDVGNNCPKIDYKKTRLLKKEAARRKFEKHALIVPEVLMHADKKKDEPSHVHTENEVSVIISEQDKTNPDHVDPVAADAAVTTSGAVDTTVAFESTDSTVAINASARTVNHVPPQLTPDLLGLFTLTLPVFPGSDLTLLSSLQDDITWFDTPVTVLCVDNMAGGGGAALIEVKLKDKDMALAVLNGLKHKYPGLEGDTTGSHADILPDKETGLYTLCFTDSKRKRYKATMEKFRGYSKQAPVISRGLGAEQVMVGFHAKEEAIGAFRENLDSEEFPELHVASVSRG